MSTRNIKDAKDLNSGELIYFKGHAKATYMSDGTTVEDAINNIEVGNGGSSGEMNVQSDWNVKDSDSPAYIKNKPTTLEGYGITDCKIDHDAGQIVIGNTTCNIGNTLTGLYPDGDALSIATVNSDNGEALDLGVQYATANRYGVVKVSSGNSSYQNQIIINDNGSLELNPNGHVEGTTLRGKTQVVTPRISLESDYYNRGLGIGDTSESVMYIKWSGDGTKFLSDDGTYKTVSSGSSSGKQIVLCELQGTGGIRFNEYFGAFEPNKIYIYNDILMDGVDIGLVTPPSEDYAEYSLIFTAGDPMLGYITTPANWCWVKNTSPSGLISSVKEGTHMELSVTASKVGNEYVYRACLTAFEQNLIDTNPT